MDKDHYLKIYQGGGYACSGKVANRGNEVYHHSPTVNGNPSFPVVSGMYVHVSGIWTRNAGTGAGTCVFENTTSNTLTNGGVIACESAGVVTNGSVVNFNTTVGGIEFQANACYFNGSLTTVLNAGNGLGFLHNCTMHCRLDGGTCFNAAGYSCWNCYAGETGDGEGYGGSILSKVTCAASDLTGTPAGLDEIEWTNTNFVNAEAHTDCSLTAAGDTAMGGEGTTPAEATRGYFDFGNLYIDFFPFYILTSF